MMRFQFQASTGTLPGNAALNNLTEKITKQLAKGAEGTAKG